MKKITKQKEPKSLVQHRANTHTSYDNLPKQTKDDIRDSLLNEQGYICCYCMKRIPESVMYETINMKIEHYKCQKNNSNLQLNYKNLFASCLGNMGQIKKLETCDTKKGDEDLSIDLLSNTPNCEDLLKYNAQGEISSVADDTEINRQINEVLNLNMQTLKEERKAVYLRVQHIVETQSKKMEQNLRLSFFEKEKNKWLNKTNGKYLQYCMVAVYYLNKKIKQYNKK